MIIYVNNYDVSIGFAYTHNHATTTSLLLLVVVVVA